MQIFAGFSEKKVLNDSKCINRTVSVTTVTDALVDNKGDDTLLNNLTIAS